MPNAFDVVVLLFRPLTSQPSINSSIKIYQSAGSYSELLVKVIISHYTEVIYSGLECKTAEPLNTVCRTVATGKMQLGRK